MTTSVYLILQFKDIILKLRIETVLINSNKYIKKFVLNSVRLLPQSLRCVVYTFFLFSISMNPDDGFYKVIFFFCNDTTTTTKINSHHEKGIDVTYKGITKLLVRFQYYFIQNVPTVSHRYILTRHKSFKSKKNKKKKKA